MLIGQSFWHFGPLSISKKNRTSTDSNVIFDLNLISSWAEFVNYGDCVKWQPMSSDGVHVRSLDRQLMCKSPLLNPSLNRSQSPTKSESQSRDKQPNSMRRKLTISCANMFWWWWMCCTRPRLRLSTSARPQTHTYSHTHTTPFPYVDMIVHVERHVMDKSEALHNKFKFVQSVLYTSKMYFQYYL